MDRFASVVEDYKGTINTFSGEEHPFAPLYYYIFGTTNRLLGRNLTENAERNVFRVDGDKLVYANEFKPAPAACKYISDFSEWLTERGTDFYFVIPASKSDDSIITYPEGFESGYAESAAALISFLNENSISYLDTRELLLATGEDFLDFFYNTDHHWNVQAGILVADAILEHLADDFGYPVDRTVCDKENYRSVVYPESMLGSLGRKTALGYTKADDMEVLFPNFKTDFYVTLPSDGIAQEGEMDGTLLLPDRIGNDLYNGGTSYCAFLYGDGALARVENRMCDNGVRVLVVKESKANIVDPYLACGVQYLDVIDPRWFPGSIRTFIEETDPDIVLLIANGPNADDDTTWLLK